MSIGSVVVQPQRLARAESAQPEDSGFADAATLLVGILRDAVGGGHVLDVFEAAGTAAAERLLANASAGLDHARSRLGTLLAVPVARLQAIATELAGVGDPAEAVAAAGDLAATLTAAVEALTIDHIRTLLAELVDILETDLGLKPDFLEQEVWHFVDDLAERLEHVAPEADAALRSNRIQVIGAMRRVRRRIGGELELPAIDVEHASGDVLAFLGRIGGAGSASRLACLGQNLADAARSGQSLLQSVPFTGFLTGSLGSAVVPEPSKNTDEYLWYPSWLANQNRPTLEHALLLVPGDEVRINREKTQIVQRNVGFGRDDQLIASGTNLAWKDHPRLGDSPQPYVFGPVSADGMEKVALVTAIMQSGIETVFNLISIEEGDHWANLVTMFGGTLNTVWKGSQKEPEPWWLDGLVFRTLLLFPATFEGVQTEAHGRKLNMWLTLAGPDYLEMLTWRYVTNLARSFLLSILTLANHDADKTPLPRNGREFDAVRHAVTLGLLNLFLIPFKRRDWGVMKDGASKAPLLDLIFFWSLVIGGIVSGLVGGLLGSLAGEAIARDANGDAIKEKMWWSIPQCFFTTIFWLYLQNEGRTDGGRFTPFTGRAYTGYPDKATSPYKLPFDPAEVDKCYVPQGNQGIFSHNFHNVGQVYSYDFSLDEGAEILAARAGTVVTFCDSIPNEKDLSPTTKAKLQTPIAAGDAPVTIDVDTVAGFMPAGALFIGTSDIAYYTSISGTQFQGVTWHGSVAASPALLNDDVIQNLFGWNFIAIRHDVDETLAALAAPHAHDKGLGGNPLTTVATYGHGFPGSVTAAFARHNPPVATEAIVDAKVKQGMPIMLAGDTGISFHNHLHMHVVGDPAIGKPAPFDYRDFGGTDDTIPFVFSDPDAPSDGVLRHFKWYTSSNTRRQS